MSQNTLTFKEVIIDRFICGLSFKGPWIREFNKKQIDKYEVYWIKQRLFLKARWKGTIIHIPILLTLSEQKKLYGYSTISNFYIKLQKIYRHHDNWIKCNLIVVRYDKFAKKKFSEKRKKMADGTGFEPVGA